MSTVSEYFGSMVFDDKVMRSMLSADVYHAMKKTINQGNSLNPEVANAVAQAMKNWAVSKGATHFVFLQLSVHTAGRLSMRRPRS